MEETKKREADNGDAMTFAGMLGVCVRQRGLVEQFERLTGRRLLSGGDDDMQAFVRFVYDCVWTRLPLADRINPDLTAMWASSLPEVTVNP